jgi:DNA-binding NtrC family response regulator
MAQLLIVEDDRITALALQRAVTRIGHTVLACVSSAFEAMAAVQAFHPDMVLLDIHLSGSQNGLLTGIDIQTLWSTPVIYLSGSSPIELDMPDFPEALWCYLSKPIDLARLCDILAWLFPSQNPCTLQELRDQLRQLRTEGVPLQTWPRPTLLVKS